MKKGFVISFDSLIAIAVMLSLFGIATFYFAQISFEAQNSIYLKKIAMDALTVMEKTGTLEKIINRDQIVLAKPFLEKMPYNVCGEIIIYSQNDLVNAEMSIIREGCKKSTQEIASIKRGFVRKLGASKNVKFYLAELNTWERE